MTYSEKLKDPRWQRRRLEVLSAANWKCEFCGDDTEPLHVHHTKYSGEPWDAPAKDLVALCASHHQQIAVDGGLVLIIASAHPRVAGRFRQAILTALERGVTWERIIEAIENIP